jgi:hypothetical protein
MKVFLWLFDSPFFHFKVPKPFLHMAKKDKVAAAPEAASTKRTHEEKAQRKADKVSRQASKALNDDRAESKASQKQNLKTAAKQLQKELDVRMGEVVARIRKETKDKLKEVVKEATRRLDVDTERMFEQALHTIVRHYDSIAPGRSGDLNFPAPAADTEATAATTPTGKKDVKASPAAAPRKTSSTNGTAESAPTPPKRAGRPTTSPSKGASTTAASRRPGRPKSADDAATNVNTPTAIPNDGVAVDNV